LPFAICGFLSVALMLCWMSRSRLTKTAWIVTSIALLGNVSFFLFCRQCRYYPLAILLSLVIAFLYLHWTGRWRTLFAVTTASILLLLTNYMPFAALYATLACDYFCFRRCQRRLNPMQWAVLLGPQLLAGLITLWIYNPLGARMVTDATAHNAILDKLTLLWWNFRDLNNCEFCAGIVLISAPLLCLWRRNIWLLRGSAALVSYVATVALVSPQPVASTSVADVRYLSALLPLCIALSSLVILLSVQSRWFMAVPLAILVFGTNVLNAPFQPARWTCRSAEYVKELCTARDTSIDMVVQWIRQNVGKGESIWVLPAEMENALMYHAPDPVYAWHLSYPPKAQFANLPPIHFIGQIPPDYIIFFGRTSMTQDDASLLRGMRDKGIEYRLVKALDIYWMDLTRPEILGRSFKPIEKFDRNTEGVYIYRRMMDLSTPLIVPSHNKTPGLGMSGRCFDAEDLTAACAVRFASIPMASCYFVAVGRAASFADGSRSQPWAVDLKL
jgi:hypothetical protein